MMLDLSQNAETFDVDAASPDAAFSYFKAQGELQPEQLNTLVNKVKPTIDYTLHSLNVGNDPVMRAEAKVVAAESIKKFNPEYGSNLNTYVSSQLKKLSRTVKERRNSVKIPERQQLLMFEVNEAEREFLDKNGREPDLAELSDSMGISLRKLEKVKRNMFAHAGEAAFEGNDIAAASEPDYVNEALEYVYLDAPHRDKKLMEYYFGYGQKEQLTPKDIALKLNISTSQVSRRAARLALKIQEIEKALKS